MKKYVLFSLLAFAPMLLCAQTPTAEFNFYKNQAKSDNTSKLSAVADALDVWLSKNYTLAQAQEAYLIKADAEVKTKNYNNSFLTLLKFKYEYPASKNMTAAAKIYEQALENADKKYKEDLKAAWLKNVTAKNSDERLDAYLYAVTKLNLKNTYAPVQQEYIRFFSRFPSYADKDRVELMYGDWQRQNKNYEAALMQYGKVYETYPSTRYKAAALRMTADIYASELEDYQQAEKLYAAILEKYPDSVEIPTVYHHMAILAETTKAYDNAVKYLEKSSEGYLKTARKTDAYETLRYKAIIEEKRLRNYSASAKTLNETAKIFADDEIKFIDTKLAEADLYAKRLKDKESELGAYRDILAKYPSSPRAAEIYFRAAKVCEDTEKYPQAMAYYQSLIVNFPADELATKAQRRINALEKKGYSPEENTAPAPQKKAQTQSPVDTQQEEEELLIEQVAD